MPGHYRGAYIVWPIALATYLIAVFHRSSLAVAGITAAERFDINAAQLATFVTLQLLVYAGMQIPVGLLVDRFGPRAVMLTGAVTLTFAQFAFGMADSYGMALVARFFVGMGDAMTFVCLLRLVNSWFTVRMIPQITLITGPIGQLGAIAAAVPMTWALSTFGWTTAYVFTTAARRWVPLGVVAIPCCPARRPLLPQFHSPMDTGEFRCGQFSMPSGRSTTESDPGGSPPPGFP